MAVVCMLTSAIAQEPVEWRKDKVTQLIFPEQIAKVRSGYTSDMALTQADGRVLYIQPVTEMSETNINVILANGDFYAFNLVYNAAAMKVNYIISPVTAIYRDSEAVATPATVESPSTEAAPTTGQQEKVGHEEQGFFARVSRQGDYITANNVAKLQKLTVLLRGVYVDERCVYFKFCIENASNVPFDVDYIAFSITAKTSKRASTQERIQIRPIEVDREIHRIDAKSSCEVIYAFEKFTIGKEKLLLAEVLEQGGDRNISLHIPESFIINARKL